MSTFLLLSGCITVDSTLKADGSGSMTMTYQAPKGATESSEKARFTSDAVTVESVTLTADHKTGTVKLKWTDVAKVSTAKGLSAVTATRTKADGTETLTIKIANASKLPPEKRAAVTAMKLEPMKITMALPGKAVHTDTYGVTKDDTVTWTIPAADFALADSVQLTVKYELPKS